MNINFVKGSGMVIKTIVDCAVKGCKVVAPVIGAMLLNGCSNNMLKSQSYGNADYSDAIMALSSCDMMDYYKRQAISTLKVDGDVAYYKAVISIAKSNMWDYYKFESIRDLNNK